MNTRPGHERKVAPWLRDGVSLSTPLHLQLFSLQELYPRIRIMSKNQVRSSVGNRPLPGHERVRETRIGAPSFRGYAPASKISSQTKSHNRSTNSSPEMSLRRALTSMGARYRLHASDLPGKPDLVFRRARLAIFVDGDFWHGRDWPKRRRKLQHGANPSYWVAKIAANRSRDRRHNRRLQSLGWAVVRLWESDIETSTRELAVRLIALVKRRRSAS
jgi:DNA mismatch endonuclease, patch repair protein